MSNDTAIALKSQQALTVADPLSCLQLQLSRPTTLLETPLSEFVKKVLNAGLSAIVIIGRGEGKGALVESIWEDFDTIDFFSGSDSSDVDSLILALWEVLGRPIPLPSDFWRRGRDGLWSRHRRGLNCFYCSRQCSLVYIKCTAGAGAPLFRADDIQDGLSKIRGCFLVKRELLANLSHYKSSILVEVPPCLPLGYLDLLKAISHGRILVLLCSPESEKPLRSAFPNFSVRRPPPPSPTLLPAIFKQRLADAGVERSPISQSALSKLAFMSRGVPQQFLALISLILDAMVDGEETVDDNYVAGIVQSSTLHFARLSEGLSRESEGLSRESEGLSRESEGLSRESEGLKQKIAGLLKLHTERSDSWISEDVGCHKVTVSRYRAQLEANGTIVRQDEFLGRDGKRRARKILLLAILPPNVEEQINPSLFTPTK